MWTYCAWQHPMASTAQPDHPGPLPEPQPELHTRALPVIRIAGPWTRMHRCAVDPLYFGRSGANRFDAPGKEFGVLYAGADPHCAFIETFGQETGVNLVTATALAQRCRATILPERPLALVDLTGSGLARIGADARLFAGEHSVAQRWARALWSHPEQPDGLYYPARHDPSRRAVAIFDRAAGSVRAVFGPSLIDPANTTLLAEILDTYRFGIL